MILNGSFADASVWTIGGGCTISGGVLNCTSESVPCSQPMTYVNGATYQCKFDYTMSSGSKLRIDFDFSGGTNVPAGGTTAVLGASGSVTLNFVANVTSAFFTIEADSAVFSGTIDNVSLKRTA